jgi:hypothetical protein
VTAQAFSTARLICWGPLALVAGSWLGCGERDETALDVLVSADEVAAEVDQIPLLPSAQAPAADRAAGPKPAPGSAAGSTVGSEPMAVARPAAPAAKDAPSSSEPAAAGVFGDWCARMGLHVDDAYDACIDTADAYWTAMSEDCAAAGLISGLSDDEAGDWFNYLIEYSYLFTGCPLQQDPPQGGLSAFGPAYFADLGLESPQLGRDDARRLSEYFTDALVTMLGLTDGDRAAVERVLARAAEQQIQPGLSGVLSQCGADAADAGAGDAGP